MAPNFSYLSNSDPEYLENLYNEWLNDPESVDYGWQKFFEGFEFGKTDFTGAGSGEQGNVKEVYVLNLINAYRTRGHLFTKTNPVRERRQYEPSLELANFNLSDADLDSVFQAGVEVGLGPATLREIRQLLEDTYRKSFGAEYMYIRQPEVQQWLRQKMEGSRNKPKYSVEEKKHILHKLNQAVVFEKFLGTKYVGQKRFSLEGAETLIPALDAVIEKGNDLGIQEFVLGMAHRGRLNVLANILGKTYDNIFAEFEENYEDHEEDKNDPFEGDVKYHHGYATDVITEKGETVHLSLCPNPSHLESVDPVALGKARAKIDTKHGGDVSKLTTILIHGDASVAGQGVVYEVVQMADLEAYHTGGTVHIVINNQVGFTTNYTDARSSIYCTDVAKVIQVPVFHVNGDDVEEVVYAVELAMEFRQQFKKDVFIDLLCYRRHGHNEGDEPRFTQPTLYKAIENHPDPLTIYFNKLRDGKEVDANMAKEMEKSFKKMLQERLNNVKQNNKAVEYSFNHSGWKELRADLLDDWHASPETGVEESKLRALAEKMLNLPEGMPFYDKVVKIFNDRKDMIVNDKLDWSMGELLAYASLLDEGYNVRMSGQDVERGTFAHRHATLTLADTDEEYTPLKKVVDNGSKFEIFNSLLSEYAVLGFEYGYSWSAPYTLSLWEAQFGDFVNGAQIIIDQYISSAETKWRRLSGLVMLLPHGYEGQGPEHSSARPERFLELCATNNMQIVNATTPAQMFHLLRRQMVRNFRVPLVVFTPKSVLRHPEATSAFAELTSGKFQEVIDDTAVKAKDVKRVLMCTGKVYYDLLAKQRESERKDIAIVRLEQLYPIAQKQLEALKAKYKGAKEWFWVQEEPENMGWWSFILRKYRFLNLDVISRRESSSPATGYKKQHVAQQKFIVKRAFGLFPGSVDFAAEDEMVTANS